MVFFSCNACGQSVKKNQVEKHYQLQCRNCEILSCVDCGKEFRGDDYKGHTRCISEEEKYGGKDFKQKQSANKGEVKQDKWIENIQSTIATAKVPRPVFNLLERLLTFSNIPRKKARFEKFLQNSLKVYDPRLISEIWDVVNVASSNTSGQKDGHAGNIQEAERCSLQEELLRNESKQLESENDISKKKKKHKLKTPMEAKRETCENCKAEGCANCEEDYKLNQSEDQQVNSPKMKTKKHKRKKVTKDEEHSVENIFETHEPVGQEVKDEGCTSSEDRNNEPEHEKKKKKHKRKKREEPDEENTVGELEGKIYESNAEEKQNYNGSEHEDVGSVAKKKKKLTREKVGASDEENGLPVAENGKTNLEGEKGKGFKSSEEHNKFEYEQIKSIIKKNKKHKRKKSSHEEEKHSEENDTQVVLHGDFEMKKRKKDHVEDTQTEIQCTKVNNSSKKKKSKSKQ